MPDEFQPHKPELTAAQVAEHVGGRTEGDPAARITGLAGLRAAHPGELTFLADRKHSRLLAETRASVLMIPEQMDLPPGCKASACIRVPDIDAALDRVARLLAPPEAPRTEGIHPAAVLGRLVALGRNVSIGPCCVIEDRVTIGDDATICGQVFIGHGASIGAGTRLHSGVKIGHGCEIGSRVILHPGVVIGGDGFGFVLKGQHHEKIPQLGTVVIEDDVEIGSNTTVDRARFGATRIGRGTKIDNLVMIAHNVQVGQHCIITAQCGIAGSTVIGDYVMIGAQTGIVGHISIGDRAKIGAGSGITKDIPADAAVLGAPAEPRERAVRSMIAIRKLPNLIEELRGLRKKVRQLCEKCGIEETTKNT